MNILLRRIYVPVASTLLFLVVGNAMAFRVSNFNALTANQNARLAFQTRDETKSLKISGLSSSEMSLASSVLNRDKAPSAGRPQLLYIGNSQTMAIMDRQPGDLTSPQWLQVLLAQRAKASSSSNFVEVRLGSFPNITPTETLIELVAAHENRPGHVDKLVLCSVLEEMRNVGVRDEVEKMARRAPVAAELARLAKQNPDLREAQVPLRPYIGAKSTSSSSSSSAGSSSNAAPTATVAASGQSSTDFTAPLETRLQDGAERLPIFAQRTNLYGQAYSLFYAFRNRLAGINSSSPRPVPPGDYATNLQLLELTLRYARSQKIPVTVYLSPIRPIQPNPNVASDVARFRRDVPALCKRLNAVCLDYLDIVPEKLWTNYTDAEGQGGQRDFAHFTGAAHKLVAEKLITDVGDRLGQVNEGSR